MSRRPLPSQHIAAEEIDGETLVLHDFSRQLFRLDPLATQVWRRLSADRAVEDVVLELAGRYRAAPALVGRDVEALLDELIEVGLLEDGQRPVHERPAGDPAAGRPLGADARRVDPPGAEARAATGLLVAGPYQAVGWRFSLRCSSLVVQSYLTRALSSLRCEGDEPGTWYELISPSDDQEGELRVGSERITTSRSEPHLCATLLWHVNRGVVASSPEHVLLHASAAERDGAVVVMSAPMESGKTTLVAGLLRAGLRYLTDEAVALDPDDLWVTPYPKPLSVDPGSWQVLADLKPELPVDSRHLGRKQWQVPPDEIRPGAVSPGGRPALVVLPRYVQGAQTRLEAVPRVEALEQLMSQRFAPDRDPRRDFEALARMVRSCACYRLESGDLEEAVRAVTAALGERAAATALAGTSARD